MAASGDRGRDPLAVAIGERIEWLREVHYVRTRGEKAPEAQQIAGVVGVPKSTYTGWIKGDAKAPPGATIRLGAYYGVDPGWITYGEMSARACWPEGWQPPAALQTTTPPQSGAAEDQGSSDEGKPRRFVRTTLPDETELVRPQRRRKGKRAG